MTVAAQPRTPTLAQLVNKGTDNALRDIYKKLPGRIETYDVARQVCSVKPLIHRLDPGDSGEEIEEVLPIINECPVLFPRAAGGRAFISWPACWPC